MGVMKMHEWEAIERDYPGTIDGPLGPFEVGDKFWAYDLDRVAMSRMAARFRIAIFPVLKAMAKKWGVQENHISLILRNKR